MKSVTIRKGSRRPSIFSNLNPLSFFNINRKSFTRTFVFTDSMIYDLHNPIAQLRWQKLYGYSLNFKFHHRDSVRFAWRWNTNNQMFEIASYSYVNGNRIYKHVYSVKPDQNFKLEIKVVDKAVQYIVNDEIKHTDLFTEKIKCWGYILGFYFGDYEGIYPRATRDMKLLVNKNF